LKDIFTRATLKIILYGTAIERRKYGQIVKGLGMRWSMAVKKVGEKYRCAVCSSEFKMTKVRKALLACCGKPLEKMEGGN
jgi:hypothetical protein